MTTPDITLGLSIVEAKIARDILNGNTRTPSSVTSPALAHRLTQVINEYERAQEPVYEYRCAYEGRLWSNWVEGSPAPGVQPLLDSGATCVIRRDRFNTEWRRRP